MERLGHVFRSSEGGQQSLETLCPCPGGALAALEALQRCDLPGLGVPSTAPQRDIPHATDPFWVPLGLGSQNPARQVLCRGLVHHPAMPTQLLMEILTRTFTFNLSYKAQKDSPCPVCPHGHRLGTSSVLEGGSALAPRSWLRGHL